MERNETKRNMDASKCLPILPGKPADSAAEPAQRSCEAVDSLLPRQRAAIAKLICGRSLAATAAELGISRTTLYRWRQDATFTRELNRLSQDAVETTATRARNLMLKATRVLADTLNNDRDRFNWALKLVNSKRLWEMGQRSHAVFDPEAEQEAPGERTADVRSSDVCAAQT
jgi:transposase-like protein